MKKNETDLTYEEETSDKKVEKVNKIISMNEAIQKAREKELKEQEIQEDFEKNKGNFFKNLENEIREICQMKSNYEKGDKIDKLIEEAKKYKMSKSRIKEKINDMEKDILSEIKENSYKNNQKNRKQVELEATPADFWKPTSKIWFCDDNLGVWRYGNDEKREKETVIACRHPILPVAIVRNIEENEEVKIKLKFKIVEKWKEITVKKSEISDSKTIIKALGTTDIDITNKNAKYLVEYFSDIIHENRHLYEETRINTVCRLGWFGNNFFPYDKLEIEYDCQDGRKEIYNAVKCVGNEEEWFKIFRETRKNEIVRIVTDTAFASILIEKLGTLSFIVHLFDGSGMGKSVTQALAASIWGNPEMGILVNSFSSSKAGLEGIASTLYNLPCILDEGETRSQESYRKGGHDNLIYDMVEKSGKIRSNTNLGVRTVKTWECCYITSGEHPLTSENSKSGAKNRTLEIQVENKIIENGYDILSVISENYGWGGKEFVKFVKECGIKNLKENYKNFRNNIMKQYSNEYSEKQLEIISILEFVDFLLEKCQITQNEIKITTPDFLKYLKNKEEIDTSERAYNLLINFAMQNSARFYIRNNGDMDNICNPIATNLPCCGRIDYVNRQIWISSEEAKKILKENELDLPTNIRKLANKGKIISYKKKNGKKYYAVNRRLSRGKEVLSIYNLVFDLAEDLEINNDVDLQNTKRLPGNFDDLPF